MLARARLFSCWRRARADVEAIPQQVLQEIAQLTKANSIEGSKQSQVGEVSWTSSRKERGPALGVLSGSRGHPSIALRFLLSKALLFLFLSCLLVSSVCGACLSLSSFPPSSSSLLRASLLLRPDPLRFSLAPLHRPFFFCPLLLLLVRSAFFYPVFFGVLLLAYLCFLISALWPSSSLLSFLCCLLFSSRLRWRTIRSLSVVRCVTPQLTERLGDVSAQLSPSVHGEGKRLRVWGVASRPRSSKRKRSLSLFYFLVDMRFLIYICLVRGRHGELDRYSAETLRSLPLPSLLREKNSSVSHSCSLEVPRGGDTSNGRDEC